jgi:hypothetical protein
MKIFIKSGSSDEVVQFDVADIINSQTDGPQVKVNIRYSEESDSLLKYEIQMGSKYTLGPYDQIMVTYRITKALRNFEEYPNDIARGFNLASMPIYYKF